MLVKCNAVGHVSFLSLEFKTPWVLLTIQIVFECRWQNRQECLFKYIVYHDLTVKKSFVTKHSRLI